MKISNLSQIEPQKGQKIDRKKKDIEKQGKIVLEQNSESINRGKNGSKKIKRVAVFSLVMWGISAIIELFALAVEKVPVLGFVNEIHHIFKEILSIAFAAVLGMSFHEQIFQEDNKLLEKIDKEVKSPFKKKIYGGLIVTILVCFVVAVPHVLASVKFSARLLYAGKGAVENFVDYNADEDVIFEEHELSIEQKQWVETQDPRLVSEIKGAEVPESERNAIKNLSDVDKNIIYFLDKVKDWDNQELINEVICEWAQVQSEKQMENIFDKPDEEGGAPSCVETEICNASQAEVDAQFAQRKEILEIRSNIHKDYPKYSLTKLIANDNHALALALYYYGGNQATIEYYYGQTIIHNMEAISYAEVSSGTCKELLTLISQRYRDVRYTCPDCDEIEKLEKLAIAFQYAADEY